MLLLKKQIFIKEVQMFKAVDVKEDFPKMEEKILEFWKKNRIFQKSLKKGTGGKEFSFYDGPPFATGKPHFGHLVCISVIFEVHKFPQLRHSQPTSSQIPMFSSPPLIFLISSASSGPGSSGISHSRNAISPIWFSPNPSNRSRTMRSRNAIP